MGMQDQYDDGRYDGDLNPGYAETEAYNAKTDEWLPVGDPRLPKSAEPQRRQSKETHMPERLTKAQIEHELRVNDQLLKELRNRRQDLQRQAQAALPAEPPSNCTMFTVSVRYKMRGKRYQFLILRSGGHYWTTGTKKDQQVFSSWESLCEWLEGPDVYDHSDIEVLKGSGQQVSFDTGTLVSERTIGEPPF